VRTTHFESSEQVRVLHMCFGNKCDLTSLMKSSWNLTSLIKSGYGLCSPVAHPDARAPKGKSR